MSLIKNSWKKFSDDVGGTWFYWHTVSHHIQLLKEYKKLFSKYIHKDSKILDLGAGRLFYRNILKKYSNNYESIDFDKTHPDLDFIGTTSNTKLKSNSFDVIFCSQVLEHVPDSFESFKEIKRILKPNGIAIISVPFLMFLHNEPYDYFRYTKYSLNKFSEDNGFKILELKEVGGLFGFFGIIFSTLLLGVFWRIPVLKYLFYFVNLLIQYALLFLDKITNNAKMFPSNYLLVVRK